MPANDLREAARTAVQLAQGNDVYFGVGLQPEDLGPHHRGRGKDVLAIPGLWADVDVQGPAHKASDLPPTKDEALSLIHEFPLPPTFVVDSGYGLQPWWLFKKLWIFRDDENRDEAQTLIRRFQATLQAKSADHGWRLDNTSDLARVMRVPGTWNHKYREPRLVHIKSHDAELRFGLSELQEMVEEQSASAVESSVDKRDKVPRNVLSDRIREGRRNVALTSVAGSLRNRGLDEDTISVVLLEVNRLRCEPLLDEQEVRRIVRSISSYPAGQPRYGRSPARRIYGKEER